MSLSAPRATFSIPKSMVSYRASGFERDGLKRLTVSGWGTESPPAHTRAGISTTFPPRGCARSAWRK